MTPARSRTQSCDRADALARMRQAEAYVAVAAQVLTDTSTGVATPGVAAALAVLAGIAAADAACCGKLKVRSRGQSRGEAVGLLSTVQPGGPAMARDLKRLLDRKDASHYGLALVGPSDAEKMVGWAKRLTESARKVVES